MSNSFYFHCFVLNPEFLFSKLRNKRNKSVRENALRFLVKKYFTWLQILNLEWMNYLHDVRNESRNGLNMDKNKTLFLNKFNTSLTNNTRNKIFCYIGVSIARFYPIYIFIKAIEKKQIKHLQNSIYLYWKFIFPI